MEKTSALKTQFQNHYHHLQEAHHLQMTEAKTKLQTSLTENTNLKSLLSSKTKENEAMKIGFEADRLQIHQTTQQLKSELKSSKEEKDNLVQTQETQIKTLKKGIEAERQQFQAEIHKITNQLQEQASALVQVYENQMETLKDDVNKSQEENKVLKQERDNFQSEIEQLRYDHSKTVLEEKFSKEKKFLISQHKEELNKIFVELTVDFNHQKLRLEEENHIQLNENSKSLEKITHLRAELARKKDQTEEMKQKFETERLQSQNGSEKFKNEIEKLKVDITARNNQTEKLKQEFENEKNIFSDEIKKLSLGGIEYQTAIRTLEEKLSASKDENNSSNERISKLSDDLQAAKQQLEPFLTQEKINQKMIDDQNALALAVEERNQEKVSSILKNSEMNINSEMKFEAKKMEGSILVLAIQNEDLEMIKMLVQDFGADVNQKIAWSHNQSNIIILAMAICYER